MNNERRKAIAKQPSEQLASAASRTRRVRIRQVGGDDGYQWCLIVDGSIRYSGMARSEAEWRRRRFISGGEL